MKAKAEQYSIRICWHKVEKRYIAWIPELDEWGVASGGVTPEQALAGLRFVRDFRLKWLRETGRTIPKPRIKHKTFED
jgi:predicted RNase H-like HicB family nuclease